MRIGGCLLRLKDLGNVKITAKEKRKIISEFKFSRDSDEVRMKLFNLLRNLDFEIGYVVIDR